MRPDGSRGVSAELAPGARLPALLWASIALAVLGLLILGGAVALIYSGARNQAAPTPPEGYLQDPTTRDRRIQMPQLPPPSAV